MLTACGGSNNNDKSNPSNNSDNSTNSSDNTPKAKLQIVSTIKPIQAIVLAITGEHAHNEQLIPDYASPHNYSFKPSHIRKVKNADVVFRIDEHMESQLNAVFESLESNAKLISLAEVEGLKLLESDDSLHEQESETNAEHEDHENIDFHIWTSLKNAVLMADKITTTLSQLDPNNMEYYQQNLEVFRESVKVEFDKNSSRFAKYQKSGYVVFHNSWQYFSSEFGLKKPLVVDLHESVSSGAKTVSDIRFIIKRENIQCVFYDASVSEARLKLLTEEVNVKTKKIDVIGRGVEMNQSAYIYWVRELSEKVEACFSPSLL